jgi:hypothetical protein
MIVYKLHEWIPKEKLNWYSLSHTDKAFDLLIANPSKINWSMFSQNHHPMVIDIIEANMDKIDWRSLSENPNAWKIIRANMDKVDWDRLCLNSNPYIVKQLVDILNESISYRNTYEAS